MKLKLGILNTDLAFCLGLELFDVSRIYSKWVQAAINCLVCISFAIKNMAGGKVEAKHFRLLENI